MGAIESVGSHVARLLPGADPSTLSRLEWAARTQTFCRRDILHARGIALPPFVVLDGHVMDRRVAETGQVYAALIAGPGYLGGLRSISDPDRTRTVGLHRVVPWARMRDLPQTPLPDRDQLGSRGPSVAPGPRSVWTVRRLALRLALVCPGRFLKGCQSVLAHPPGVSVTGYEPTFSRVPSRAERS
jgi:hypothetical protein